MARTHGKCHRNLRHFVPGTADVKEDLPLSQQDQDLGINEASGKCIRVCADDLIYRQVCQGVRGRVPGVFRFLTLRPRFDFGRQRLVSLQL
jgi:hypothetical protein